MMKGMSERLKECSMYRTQRRNRLRHRKPRFENRKKDKGWLAPSIQHKLDTHFKVIEMLKKVLPISQLTIEIADFDIQKIKNPDIQNRKYQQGEKYGFSHLRQYILRFRKEEECVMQCKTLRRHSSHTDSSDKIQSGASAKTAN